MSAVKMAQSTLRPRRPTTHGCVFLGPPVVVDKGRFRGVLVTLGDTPPASGRRLQHRFPCADAKGGQTRRISIGLNAHPLSHYIGCHLPVFGRLLRRQRNLRESESTLVPPVPEVFEVSSAEIFEAMNASSFAAGSW